MKYVRNNNFYSATLDNEICIFDPDRGKYHNLNKVGSRIWEILQNDCSIDEIVNSLLDTYEVSREQCYSDTNEFIKVAVKDKIIFSKQII